MRHLKCRLVTRAATEQRRAGRAAYRALMGQLFGTHIRHRSPPLDVRSLPIPMVLPSIFARLVPSVGARLCLLVASASTFRAAIHLPSIAMAADAEDLFATGACRLP
jgi:hypothetical protein